MSLKVGAKAGRRRVGWIVADQGVSSALNFGVAVFAARMVPPEAFGGFALAFSIYLICLGIARACVSAPLSIRFSTASPDEWRGAVSRSSSASLLFGFGLSPLLFAAGLLAAGTTHQTGECLMALAVALPGLLLQDQWRFAFFAQGAPRNSFITDLVWSGAILMAFSALLLAGIDSVSAIILAWGSAAWAGALIGCTIAGTSPMSFSGTAWFRQHRDLSPSLVSEFVLSGGVTQLLVFSVAATAGMTAAGALRGAQVLFGPVNVVLMAATATAVPEGARLLRHTPAHFPTGMRAVSAVVGLTALAWGALVGGFVPDSIGREILGPTWNDARQVVAPLGVLMAIIGAGVGALTGLRVLELPQRSVKARAIGAPFLLIGGLLGAIVAGAPGAVWGQCCPMALLVIAWWVQFTDAEARRRQGAPTSSP